MAASSGDDDSVWPGYVDALTTMVMVMTMVMMIMGVVVFGTSQGISRKFLERVANAANVDAGSNVSTTKLSDELLAWVQRHADLGSAPYLSPGDDRPRGGATQGVAQMPNPGVTSRQLSTRGPLQADEDKNPSGPNVGPPLDDVTATAQIDQAVSRIVQQEKKLQSQKDDIEADLRQFYWQLESARGKQAGLADGVETSLKARELYNEQFRGGKRSLLELLDIETAYFSARRTQITNRFDEQLATFGIIKSVGRFVRTVVGSKA